MSGKNGNTWSQLGSSIQSGHLGFSISLNNAGDVLVVSDPYRNSTEGVNGGIVNAYQFTGTDWIQKGGSIIGVPHVPGSFAEMLGWEVDIDDSGNTIAVCSPFINGRDEGAFILLAIMNGS